MIGQVVCECVSLVLLLMSLVSHDRMSGIVGYADCMGHVTLNLIYFYGLNVESGSFCLSQGHLNAALTRLSGTWPRHTVGGVKEAAVSTCLSFVFLRNKPSPSLFPVF